MEGVERKGWGDIQLRNDRRDERKKTFEKKGQSRTRD